MHVAALPYHYGQSVADNRHSKLWFAELGGRSIQGISSAGRFLEEVLRDLWIPEMKAFVAHQLHQRPSQRSRGSYITFKVYRSKIIVECNEDGFTERDLTAICDVGQSTKLTEYGYIGAKGTGFKSVFIATSKVYIQSGNFSFKFEHKKEDPGLGMVRPIWVEPADELRKIIVNQLDSLQESCLLFLKNLQRIQVSTMAMKMCFSGQLGLRRRRLTNIALSSHAILLPWLAIPRHAKFIMSPSRKLGTWRRVSAAVHRVPRLRKP